MSNSRTALYLAIAVLLTRLPFTSNLLYNMDSVQFALAMDHFDVALHQPQPPGFFLYVLLGRLARHIFPDANSALISLSITFSVLLVIGIYFLGREVFDSETGIAASVIAATSPLLWFHGEVALSYMPEAFMSVLVALLCYKVLKGETGLFWLSAIMLGIAGGVRQNTMVFLAPLWLYSMKGLGIRRAAASLAIFGVTVLAWSVPMLSATGGYARFDAAMTAHWLDTNWHGVRLGWVLFNARHISTFMLYGLGFALAPLLYGLYFAIKGQARPAGRQAELFFSLWLLPPFLFHLIIFTHPAVPGHSLIYLVGLLALTARAVTSTPARAGRRFKASVLAFVAASNAAVFLFTPYPLTAKGIRAHDEMLSGYINTVRLNFSPADTEIIGSDRFLLSYRHAMYYLPEYRVYDDVLLSTPEGPRLFWGQDRTTHRSRYITLLPSTRHFVDFINHGRYDLRGLPPGAKVISIPGGNYLVDYENREDLYNVKRVAPLLDPAMKGV